MYDILIKNGTIIDGSGENRYEGNIGVKDGKIECVGKCIDKAKKYIDAKGHIICPGFIDCHSHSDFSLLDDNANFGSYLKQGITTEIAGMCGGTVAPITKELLRDSDGPIGMLGLDLNENVIEDFYNKYKDFNSYYNYLEKRKLGTNFAVCIGHSSIRSAVIGPHNRKPTDEELEKMKSHVRIAMESGALGLTTGLIYPPGAYADEDEIVALCEVVAEYGGIYCSHMRSEGDMLIKSIKETINIGRRAGILVNISHIKIAGKNNWGKYKEVIKLIDDANEEGIKVTADMYPYKAGSTALINSLPPKHASEGNIALIKKLKNPEFRAQVKEELFNQTEDFENMIEYCGFDGIVVLNSSIKEMIGKTVEDIAAERNKDVFETYCDIIVETNGSCICGYFMRDDKDIEEIFKHPLVMGGSDGGIESLTFPTFHPRQTGTFPKLLKDFVIEKQLVTLEEAIRKFTSLPANTARFNSKGLLKEGYDADILVIDVDNLDHTSNYINPKGKNKGFKYVIVNGKIVVKDDEFLDINNGRLLKVK